MINNDVSGLNTFLIIIVLVLLVGGGIYFYMSEMSSVEPAEIKKAELNLDL